MGRLIDADALIKEYPQASGLKLVIENAPTAYDVDKVVEELECDRCESCSLLEVCAGSKCCGKCHEKIIEIVKRGGASDDVCEWHKGKNGNAYKCNTHAEIHDSRVLDWQPLPQPYKENENGKV